MRSSVVVAFAAGFASQAYAACSSALKIDDFSKYSSNTNSLNSWTSGMTECVLRNSYQLT